MNAIFIGILLLPFVDSPANAIKGSYINGSKIGLFGTVHLT